MTIKAVKLKGTETLMKHITCIEDLRELQQAARAEGVFSIYADRGFLCPSKRCAPIATTCRTSKFRQRILVDVSKRDSSTTILGETRRACR